MKVTLWMLLCLLVSEVASANNIDSLENRLRSEMQVQEKVYLHTDNNSYFVGDTLWYKAYVINAHNLRPAALSKILYVELLTPDGYLVERQRVIVDHNTQSCGQFAIPDTIFSGFYELRAYTRWQLNFNVSEREHSSYDDQWFYSKQMAKDYYRDYEGLYSRVIPIYEKPTEAGDYTDRRIVDRPKRRQAKAKEGISLTFFPEGGSLVAGLDNRVAFEVLDAYGKPLELEVTVNGGPSARSDADGRGLLAVKVNEGETLKATVQYQGKVHSFALPEPLGAGAIIAFDAQQQVARATAKGIQIGALSVTCRGALVSFLRDTQDWVVDASQLPTGVNEIVAYDTEARPLAVRQIFVNHNDRSQLLDVSLQTADESVQKADIIAAPYQKVGLQTNLGQRGLITVSVAVRDQRGEEPTYSDGNIMTELLLAGDLKGYVAHPAYYFEADDAAHRTRLDLLMMIQGWRKYAPVEQLRYEHERAFVLSGQVHTLSSHDRNEFDLLEYVHNADSSVDATNPCFTISTQGQVSLKASGSDIPDMANLNTQTQESSESESSDGSTGLSTTEDDSPGDADTFFQNEYLDHTRKKLKHKVLVEAELTKDTDVAGVVVDANEYGDFAFNLPPFYDQGIMFMTAYNAKDSARMCLTSTSDKYKLDPFSCPDYYVKRDYFYPHFSQPYSWFQTHNPEEEAEEEGDSLRVSLGMEHILDNVVVKQKRRRVLRAFDRTKPAFVYDFGKVYNEAIDCGLHRGGFNSITFFEEAARTLFGNMNEPHRTIGIRGTVDGHIFLKTYNVPDVDAEGVGRPMTPAVLKKRLDPKYMWKLRIFTDYDMRNGVGKEENRGAPDVWFEVIPVPNDGSRATRRDRRFVFDGFVYPEEFYHRDYSGEVPTDTADYRRTYYWNPNAHPDKEGNLSIDFYNGTRPSQMKISLCGIGPDGKIYYTK